MNRDSIRGSQCVGYLYVILWKIFHYYYASIGQVMPPLCIYDQDRQIEYGCQSSHHHGFIRLQRNVRIDLDESSEFELGYRSC